MLISCSLVSIEIHAAFAENFDYFVHVVFADRELLVLPQDYIFVTNTGLIDDVGPDQVIRCEYFSSRLDGPPRSDIKFASFVTSASVLRVVVVWILNLRVENGAKTLVEAGMLATSLYSSDSSKALRCERIICGRFG